MHLNYKIEAPVIDLKRFLSENRSYCFQSVVFSQPSKIFMLPIKLIISVDDTWILVSLDLNDYDPKKDSDHYFDPGWCFE